MKNNFLKKKVDQLQNFKNNLGKVKNWLFPKKTTHIGGAKINTAKRSWKTTSSNLLWQFLESLIVIDCHFWEKKLPNYKISNFLKKIFPSSKYLQCHWFWKRVNFATRAWNFGSFVVGQLFFSKIYFSWTFWWEKIFI